MSIDVLIIDDEKDICELISDTIKEDGFTSRTATNSGQAFKLIAERVPNAIILDIWLQGSELDGLGILEIVKKRYPIMPVIVISGHGTIETAISALKIGAYDYLEKPFVQDKLLITLKRACEAAKLRRENIDLRSKVIDKTEFIGNSSLALKLKSEIEKVAPTSGRVMIYGGVGSGKELTARMIHKLSKRAGGPFITFSPTAMSLTKMQQELFGEYDKQDNPSVASKRLCVLESVNKGTLYIDEVADLPIMMQNRLLRFLKDQTIVRHNNAIKLDIRIIASTSKDLNAEIVQGRFKQDLFYRLNVVPIHVPSLSERKEDIPLLVKYFVKQLSKFSGLKEREFSEEAIAALQAYGWSGNIRQLRNITEWVLIMNPPQKTLLDQIKSDMLPPDVLSNSVSIIKPDTNVDMMSMPLREAREVFETQYLSAQLRRFGNNISKTAEYVGMERSALHRKLKMLGIHSGCGTKSSDEAEYMDLEHA